VSTAPDIRDHDLFEWLPDEGASSLNGHSTFRTALPFKFTEPGDAVVGEVVAVERSTHGFVNQFIDSDGLAKIVVRCRAARSGGEDIAAGEWLSFWLSFADLRRAWHQAGGIARGDSVTFGYLGKQDYAGGFRHSFAFHIGKGDGPKAEARW